MFLLFFLFSLKIIFVVIWAEERMTVYCAFIPSVPLIMHIRDTSGFFAMRQCGHSGNN